MKAKGYPLEIRALYESGSRCGLYSKGHHDPVTFIQAVKDYDGTDLFPGDIHHDERRFEVCDTGDGPVSCLNVPRAGTTRRGVFPVTIAEWY